MRLAGLVGNFIWMHLILEIVNIHTRRPISILKHECDKLDNKMKQDINYYFKRWSLNPLFDWSKNMQKVSLLNEKLTIEW